MTTKPFVVCPALSFPKGTQAEGFYRRIEIPVQNAILKGIALSKSAYDELAEMETFALVISRFHVLLVIIRIAEEEIEIWKN